MSNKPDNKACSRLDSKPSNRGLLPGAKRACTRCGEEKLETDFPRPYGKKQKPHYWCRACMREYSRERMRIKYRNKMAALGESRKWCCKGCHVYTVVTEMDRTRLDTRGRPRLCLQCAKFTDEELKERAYQLHREKQKKQYASDFDYWIKQRFFGFRTAVRAHGHDVQFEDFDRRIRDATKTCPICNVEMERTGGHTTSARTACLDHNHTTGQLRQVICARCNRVLGIVEENIALLDSLKAYLQHHQAT